MQRLLRAVLDPVLRVCSPGGHRWMQLGNGTTYCTNPGCYATK